MELLGDGIRFGDVAPWTLGVPPATVNVVSGNLGDGIYVGGDASDVEVVGNFVGVGLTGTERRGNDGDGIVIDGALATLVGRGDGANVVGDNGGAGIRVGSSTGVTAGIAVAHNLVGQLLVEGQQQNGAGNGGDGIVVQPGAHALYEVNVLDNFVRGSGAVGVRVAGGSSVALARNRVFGSAECGVLVSGGAGATLPPPVIVGRSAMTIYGTIAPPVGVAPTRVEVFWDSEDEAREYLGEATLVGTSWELQAREDSPFPFGGRVIATLTANNGTITSGVEPGCGDGCAAAGVGSCNDGNVCTSELCGLDGTCAFADNDGASCTDGSRCTTNDTCQDGVCGEEPAEGCVLPCTEPHPTLGITVQRDCTINDTDGNACDNRHVCSMDTGRCVVDEGNLKCKDGLGCTEDECLAGQGCKHDLLLPGFPCEDGNACTGLGLCDASGSCGGAEPLECPFEGTWSVGSCDPEIGCTYEGVNDPVGQAYCGPDELCDDPFGDCREVLGMAPNDPWNNGGEDADEDEDGIPDLWEVDGEVDFDGDGNPELVLSGADPNIPDIFVEIDFMRAPDHDDVPLTADLPPTFSELDELHGKSEAYNLHVDLDDPLPHHEFLTMSPLEAPNDPDCSDWASLWEHKNDSLTFDPRRKGLFHYVVSGHRACGPANGTGEVGGDDVILMLASYPGNELVIDEGSLMHELGHNFGLEHGGDRSRGGMPNYQSSMNSRYGARLVPFVYDAVLQAPPGSVPEGQRDYSALDLELDENHLNEFTLAVSWPADGMPEYWIRHTCDYPDPFPADFYDPDVDFWAPDDPIDWDCDQVIEADVEVDLDGDGQLTLLPGHDDWANLQLELSCHSNGSYADNVLAPLPDEPSEDDLARWGTAVPTLFPRHDLLPGCTTNPVPEDGTGQVQLAVFGDDDLDVTAIASIKLAGAGPTASRYVDVDADQALDLVFAFDVADLQSSPPATRLVWWGRTEDSQVLFGQPTVSWIPTATDADQDGVENGVGCDDCPLQAGPAASEDGCP